MKGYLIITGCLVFLLVITAAQPAMAKKSCEGLMSEKLPHVTITSAAFMNDPLGFLPPKTPGVFGTPPDL
ncbi:MAG: hypothetical protein P8Z37_11835, partial [Acidobacteriota bacterium]